MTHSDLPSRDFPGKSSRAWTLNLCEQIDNVLWTVTEDTQHHAVDDGTRRILANLRDRLIRIDRHLEAVYEDINTAAEEHEVHLDLVRRYSWKEAQQ